MNVVYLSRRNLLTLLSKLDRELAGDKTFASLIKRANDVDPVQYRNTQDFMVVAVQDEVYYASRLASPVHEKDDPDNKGEKNVH